MRDENQIKKLHAEYCEQSGLVVSLTLGRIYAWEVFTVKGFTFDDLNLVCRNLRRAVKIGKRGFGCMGFTRLIIDLENFEELLAEFRAAARKPKYSPGKSEALRLTGRPTEPAPVPPKDAKTVLKGLGIAARLREFRENEL